MTVTQMVMVMVTAKTVLEIVAKQAKAIATKVRCGYKKIPSDYI